MIARTLKAEEIPALRPQLVELLRDAVDSGASLGYLAPMPEEDAIAFWDAAHREALDNSTVVVASFDETRVVGCVLLDLDTRPNARHRAEVQKLMVLRDVRGRGVGRLLMSALEEEARRRGRTLLVLDTRKGDPAEALYLRWGYFRAGEIPGFTRDAEGNEHATVVFYKELPTA